MAETSRIQYQHFVPQFLLRNWSHPYKPPSNGRKKSKQTKRKYEKGMYPGDRVVNTLNLKDDSPVPIEAPVNGILGQMDMYRDQDKPSAEQQHIELMFSKLEGQASIVFRKITKAFEQNEKGLWLKRDERDLVRKFLFLLKYRGSTFHRRFYHDNAECYEANDRELLWEYMSEKGFKRPTDVWFHNLKTIMELRMDPEKKWVHDLPKLMFVDDAMWFITHAQCMYMAICTPSSPSDEFILTDNSYNVFEGPNSFATDRITGKVEGTAYTPLHEFAPLSPRLMIVLRSGLIAVPEEDANPGIKEGRDTWRSMALDMVYTRKVESRLSGLPITKPSNNYSAVVNGRIQYNQGEDGKGKRDHEFCFKYFPIATQHVHTINGIFLENSYRCSRVVFGAKESLSRTLETHVNSPRNLITGDDSLLRLEFIKKLVKVSKSLDSEKEPIWREEPVTVFQDYECSRLKTIEIRRQFSKYIKGDWMCDNDNELWQVYKSLDGSEQTLYVDMDQAKLMWMLRVKIDVWSQGLDESLRNRNRLLLIEIYLRLPPRRVWFFITLVRLGYLKRSRGCETEIDENDFTEVLEGLETTIARGKYLVSTLLLIILIILALQIIKPTKLTQLMYKTALNEIKLAEHQNVNLWAKINKLDKHGIEQIRLLRQLNSSEPRYIRHCGILEIEQLARNQEVEVLKDYAQSREEFPILEASEIIELLARIRLRSRFMKTLDGKLEKPLLKALKKVFFEVLFPTPS